MAGMPVPMSTKDVCFRRRYTLHEPRAGRRKTAMLLCEEVKVALPYEGLDAL